MEKAVIDRIIRQASSDEFMSAIKPAEVAMHGFVQELVQSYASAADQDNERFFEDYCTIMDLCVPIIRAQRKKIELAPQIYEWLCQHDRQRLVLRALVELNGQMLDIDEVEKASIITRCDALLKDFDARCTMKHADPQAAQDIANSFIKRVMEEGPSDQDRGGRS